MKFTSLHSIVNSVLLQRGAPNHFYMQYLKYASDCLRELHFDTLKVVNTVELEGETEYCLPDDVMDIVRVGWRMECKDKWYSPYLLSCDCYGNSTVDGMYWRYGNWFGMWMCDGYEIVGDKLKVNRTGKAIVDYISDCSHIDNATRVDPYAQKTIEDYMEWQYKRWNRSYHPREILLAKEQFDKSHTRLRSRKSDLTIDLIKMIIRKGAATPIKG